MLRSPGDAGDRDLLPDDLAALYRADAQYDAIDVDSGWPLLRARLGRPFGPRRIRAFVMAVAATGALAASVLLVLHTRSNAPTSESPAASSRRSQTTVTAPDSEYRQVVADLERTLRAGRDHLQPETALAIDGSLAAIDRAMHDAAAALAADPTNGYAADWLDAMRRRKMTALRQAVSDVDATF